MVIAHLLLKNNDRGSSSLFLSNSGMWSQPGTGRGREVSNQKWSPAHPLLPGALGRREDGGILENSSDCLSRARSLQAVRMKKAALGPLSSSVPPD